MRKGYTVSYNKRQIAELGCVEANARRLVVIGRAGRMISADLYGVPTRRLPRMIINVQAMTAGTCVRQATINGRVAMVESFYMTNICPQNNNLKQGRLEGAGRGVPRRAKGEQGCVHCVGLVLYDRPHKTIGKHKVVVPREAFFKVVLSLGDHPKAIGFIIKHRQSSA